MKEYSDTFYRLSGTLSTRGYSIEAYKNGALFMYGNLIVYIVDSHTESETTPIKIYAAPKNETYKTIFKNEGYTLNSKYLVIDYSLPSDMDFGIYMEKVEKKYGADV